MHELYDHLCQKLDELLKRRSVVVFYDPKREFHTFFDRELSAAASSLANLARVSIRERQVHVAWYLGSFYGVRAAVEPIFAKDRPDPLIIYVPGVTRDREGSMLMEIEMAGTCCELQLKRVARDILRNHFPEAQIDDMLRPAGVTYDDIVLFLKQAGKESAFSILKALFDGAGNEALLVRWLIEEARDQEIVAREAVAELFSLIEVRLGLSLPAQTTLTEAREKCVRYVLVGEFRSDLTGGEPPAAIGMVPAPSNSEQVERICEVARQLRASNPDRYTVLADRVEQELGLDRSKIQAFHLGVIDTFRFEEIRLLEHAGDLTAARKYDKALEIATGRNRSFWVDQDVARQEQWKACRLMAELGRAIECARPLVSSTLPAAWVSAYTSDDGWFEVDRLQRRLETWVSQMSAEPECDKALGVVRQEHEELLKRMAEAFSSALAGSAWTIPEVLHQTRIYPDVVKTMGGPVAYFLVDALRYEMGVELHDRIQGTLDRIVRPAVAALPTITPVGMAALLPGASASFSVIPHQDRLAAAIEGTVMPGSAERSRFLKAVVPDVVDLTLAKLLAMSSSAVLKAIAGASLVVVRSQEIDMAGERGSDYMARQEMDWLIGNVARAVKKLASAGMERFVITADHGHQFTLRKEEDMRTDHPGGVTLQGDRRYWAGRGGTTPPGTVRISGPELGYDNDFDFVFPTGLGVFRAGGGLSFHHGGISLQELVIPVVSFRIPAPVRKKPAGRLVLLSGVPDRLTNRTFSVRLTVSRDLFATEPVALRVVLVSKEIQVGQAGMAIDAILDDATGVLHVIPGKEAGVGLRLTRDDCKAFRVVVLDPVTDAVLEQSDEIPVKLEIGP